MQISYNYVAVQFNGVTNCLYFENAAQLDKILSLMYLMCDTETCNHILMSAQ